MTQTQIARAKRHDWFVDMDGIIMVVLEVSTKDGITSHEVKTFENFQALYRWAGY